MNKLIIACIISTMLFFSTLYADNLSKADKSLVSSGKEELSQEKQVTPAQTESIQPVLVEKSVPAQAEKEQPAQSVQDKPSQPEKAVAVQKAQDKPVKVEQVQEPQTGRTFNPEPIQEITPPASNSNVSKPEQPKTEQVNYNKSVKDKPSLVNSSKLPQSYSEQLALSKSNKTAKADKPEEEKPPLFSTGKPDENAQMAHTETGNPIQPAYIKPATDDNPPNDDHHPGHNGHGGYHGGYGQPSHYGYNDNYGNHHRYRGYDRFHRYGYGNGGINIYFNIVDDYTKLRGYLVDNDWDLNELNSNKLYVNYKPFPFKDIHTHTENCPKGAYGIMVMDSDGYYTFFHFDKKGNKLAAKLLNKTWSFNKKIRIEITGMVNMKNQTISVWTLKKVPTKRQSDIGSYQIYGVDIDTAKAYFGCDNYLGRFDEQSSLWARF